MSVSRILSRSLEFASLMEWLHKFTNLHACNARWRHQSETFSALLAICAGNSPVPVEFPTQRPVSRSFDIFFDLHPNKRLSKQCWGWWSETPSCPLWRHHNGHKVNSIRYFINLTKSSEGCLPWQSELKPGISHVLWDAYHHPIRTSMVSVGIN